MTTTAKWCRHHGLADGQTLDFVPDYQEPCRFSAEEIATRAIVLNATVAVAAGVDSEPVVDWLVERDLWRSVSPLEKRLFQGPSGLSQSDLMRFQWQMESEWTLLWAVEKVEALALPVQQCDSGRLVDQIIPALGSDVGEFLSTAKLRSPGALLAEDDRHYNMWCYLAADRRNSVQPPEDLHQQVLYQRVYAFNWLSGPEEWDEVVCDA